MARESILSRPESFPELAGAYRAHLTGSEWGAVGAWFTGFYPFQLKWLLEPSRRACSVKARQIGWSHTTAANAVLWGAFHGELTTVVSRGEREALEVLDKAKKHAQVLAALGSRMAVPTKSNATELHFASGGRVIALPSTGARGFTGNAILDEYAYHEHARDVWDATVPAAGLGGFRVRVMSTPNGAGNEFHELVEAIRLKKMTGWSLHKVSIDDAIADGFPVNLQDCWADAKGDPRLFSQLFKCEFLDGLNQYLPTEAVEDARKAVIPYTGQLRCFAGLDIGKTSDHSVLIVITVDPQAHKAVVWIRRLKRTDYKLLHEAVAQAFVSFPIVRMCVDATGLGSFEADRIVATYGKPRVEPVTFTSAVKEDLATSLYSNLVHRSLDLPETDKSVVDGSVRGRPPRPIAIEAGAAAALASDLLKLRREVTSAGNVRYDAARTDEGHADSAWALGLALHAASAPIPYRTKDTDLPSFR